MNLNLLTEAKLTVLKNDLLILLKGIDDLPDMAKDLRDTFVKRLDEYIASSAIRRLNLKEKQKMADQGLIDATGFDLHQAACVAQKNGDWKSFGEFKEEIGRRYEKQGYRQPKFD